MLTSPQALVLRAAAIGPDRHAKERRALSIAAKPLLVCNLVCKQRLLALCNLPRNPAYLLTSEGFLSRRAHAAGPPATAQ